ncbi:MAG: hypothetical protein J0H98_08210 [Solirubrobacterales bacterium]|nr:hypothetical protein [Solirubrobacterales bacterium]
MTPYTEHKVGINTAVAGLAALLLTKAGVDVPNGVIVAAVGLVGLVTAYFSPGWADKVGLRAYPAGFTAATTTVLAWFLPAVGVNEFTQADLVTIVGAFTLIVGLLTPASDDPPLDRERVGA